jgi:hypothetical protein
MKLYALVLVDVNAHFPSEKIEKCDFYHTILKKNVMRNAKLTQKM